MADRVTFYYKYQNLPQNAGRIVVSIEQDTATARTVQIGDYSKIITEQSQVIDITRYYPYDYDDVFLTARRLDTDSGFIPAVTIDGTTYKANVVWLPNAPALYSATKMRDGWLSDLPYLLVTPNMLYGWTIGNASGGSIYYNGGHDRISNDTNIPDALSMCENWVKGIGKGELSLWASWLSRNIIVPYVSRPLGLNGVRIAWINRYGCVDFWNFDFCRERKLAVEAKKIYTGKGYQMLGAVAETTYTVETRELTQEILAALSQILYSPAVWTVGADGTTKEIDIITDECRIFSDTELSTLQLEYRPKMRDL